MDIGDFFYTKMLLENFETKMQIITCFLNKVFILKFYWITDSQKFFVFTIIKETLNIFKKHLN